MKLCQGCGQLLAEDIGTCPVCGNEVAEGRRTIDDYRIIEVLHEGYATTLCRAVKEDAEESVMIRIFSPQAGVDEKIAERLKNELEELQKLREKIYAKKEIISKIKLGHKTIEKDKVKVKLETMIQEYGHLRDHFKSGATQINLVLNNDKLSFSEAFRIKKKLMDIGINIKSILINKSQSKVIPDEVRDEFNHQKIALFPFSSKNILGYQAINQYIDENSAIFAEA